MSINKWAALVIVIVFAALAWWYYAEYAKAPTLPAPAGYQDATYTIDGAQVTLVGGTATTPAAPGSASQVTTRYFGNEANGDLNGDGVPDEAFVLTQEGGGSGTFYYVAAALQGADGAYTGTNAILLGDRIAPQTTQIKNGIVIANFADRAPGDPMTSQPSVGVSKYLELRAGQLLEVPAPIADVSYACDAGKTIGASYFEGSTTPGQNGGPPTPGGSVGISLSDGRSMSLPQTISADGARYANQDESFIFWSKGNGAFVMEAGTTTFANCTQQ